MIILKPQNQRFRDVLFMKERRLAFGIMGLFIGPVVVSVTIAVLDMLREINAPPPESEQRVQTAVKGGE